MGSLHRNTEIIEASEELSSVQHIRRYTQARVLDKEQKPPMIKKGSSKYLEDDINKLFESINLRTAKSLDLTGTGFYRKNASKKPMRTGLPHSPGIGFSEPVSLKQSLRGLCISQAAEMAAMKRLSKLPGSPRPLSLEGGKSVGLYRPMISESGQPVSFYAENGIEISLVPEESTSTYFAKGLHHQELKTKSAGHSACTSPQFFVHRTFNKTPSPHERKEISMSGESTSSSAEKMPRVCPEPKVKMTYNVSGSSRFAAKPTTDNIEVQAEQIKTASISVQANPQSLKAVLGQDEEKLPVPSLSSNIAANNALDPVECTSDSNKETAGSGKNVVMSVKITNKVAPKLRRKGKLQGVTSSGASKSIKDTKSTRSASRAIKPAMRNKTLVRRKIKPEASSAVSNANSSSLVNSALVSPGQAICQRCQCNLDSGNEPCMKLQLPSSTNTDAEVKASNRTFGVSKLSSMTDGYAKTPVPIMKNVKASKTKEPGDFSQSSSSSIGDYSSSTMNSEESNASGSIGGNRPHMSKDLRWEAINQVKKQQGFLGLRHFSLLKKLGCGDIGTVYLAELIGTSCLFAIKVMDNEFLARRKKMSRAETEKDILKILDHPFLPTLYAQFTTDNLSCLVMEFCPGGDLHVLRQKQPGRYFAEQAARFYVAEVLLALEYLHMLGIVYRDLKPENILVRDDGHIMLTDFDLSLRCSVNPTLVKPGSLGIEPPRISGPCAGSNCIDPFCAGPSCQVSCFSPRILPAAARARKHKADLQAQARSSLPQLVAEPTEARSNSFVGTHEYLAPEIIKGEGHGSAVDWWTLGVFLYELLYGRTPFKGANNEETLANVVLQSLRFPEGPIVSFQARDLIRGLLVKEPENRLGTETGAAEIKRHPFFDGLNWALIRCATPPQVPGLTEAGAPKLTFYDKGGKYLEYSTAGEHLEFELF